MVDDGERGQGLRKQNTKLLYKNKKERKPIILLKLL